MKTNRSHGLEGKAYQAAGVLFFAWCALWPGQGFSLDSGNAAGLSIPLDNALASARSAAFASAFVAVADDGDALFWNPAGLGNLTSGELSLHHQVWMADTSQDTFLAALPVAGLGGFALAANYMNYGSFAGRDSTGAPMPSVSADRLSLDAGWGFRWTKGFSAGVGLRASRQNLSGSSYETFSSDGGILFQPAEDLSLGLAFTGLGTGGPAGDLPFALRLGAAFRPDLSHDWRLLLCGAGSLEQGGLNRVQAGAEAVYRGCCALRAGYQLNLVDDRLEGLSGLTLGAGYQWQGLSLDYAFLPMGDLGTSHRVSLAYHFPTGASDSEKNQTATEKKTGVVPDKAGAGNTAPSPSPVPSPAISPALPFGEKPETSAGTSGISTPSTAPPGEEDSLEIQFKLPPDALRQGKDLEKQGKYTEAIAVYTQAIQNDQKNLLAWWGLGNIYYRLGRKDYAVPCFEQVLKIKPEAVKLREWLEKYRSAPPSTPAALP